MSHPQTKSFKSIILTVFMVCSASQMTWAQPAITPMVGKAFADKNGASAVRLGLGLQQVYRDRWGIYYSYEYRSNVMFFENTPYSKNEYRRDVAGVTCKVHPNFTMYGGVGLFMDGFLKGQLQNQGAGIPWVIKPEGLRKEIGVTYQPNNMPMQISAGYSWTIGFTSNFGWCIPLRPDRMTVHQSITQD
jgi:hypothetical protein